VTIYIWFWNAEKLSPHAEATAVKFETKSDGAYASWENFIKKPDYVKPITRGAVKTYREETKAGPSSSSSSMDTTEDRDYLKALTFTVLRDDAAEEAQIKANKYKLAQDIIQSAPYACFCEVVDTHPDQRTSLLGAATTGTLCYAHYQNRVSTAFAACPAGADAWIAPGDVPHGIVRVPKGFVVAGVRFCFWHAPSGNNGQVVADMFSGLIATGQPTVLFGDLNCEPSDLRARGIPDSQLLHPSTATRISGRCLDFAVTNVKSKFHGIRALNSAPKGYNIKTWTGSDHMVMILDMIG
jgi:hypothetical protein